MQQNREAISAPHDLVSASAASAVRFFRLLQRTYSSPAWNEGDWEPAGPEGLRRSAAAPQIRHRHDGDEATKWDFLRDSLLLGDHLEYLRSVLDHYEFTRTFQDASRADLRRLGMRLADRRLFLGVVGEFSSGKSTLINALLREPFLQTDVLQGTTSVPTQVGYGHHLDAQVLFRDGTTEWFTRKRLSERRRWPWLFGNLEQVSQADRGCLTEFLRQHTASPQSGNQVATVYLSHPAKRFETEGIVVIDTPGTCSSDYPQHEHTTRQAVQHLCDAVVVVIPANAPVSESLLKYLEVNVEELLPRCIFVVTKLDLLRPAERSAVVNYVKARLEKALGRPRPPVVAAAPGIFLQHYCHSDGDGERPLGRLTEADIDVLAQEYLVAERRLIEFLRAGKLMALAGGIAGRMAHLMVMLEKELKRKGQEYGGQRKALEDHPIPSLVELGDGWKNNIREQIWDKTKQLQEQATAAIQSANQSLTLDAEKLISETQDRSALSAVIQTSLSPALRREEDRFQQSSQAVHNDIANVAHNLHAEIVAAFQQAYPTLAPPDSLLVPASSFSKSQELKEAFARSVSTKIESTLRDFIQEAASKEWGLLIGIAVAGLVVGTLVFPGVGTVFGAILGGIVGRVCWQQWEERKSAARSKAVATIRNAFDEFRPSADRTATGWVTELENSLLAAINACVATHQKTVEEMIERDEKMKAQLLSWQKEIRADLSQLQHRHADLRKAESKIVFSLSTAEDDHPEHLEPKCSDNSIPARTAASKL